MKELAERRCRRKRGVEGKEVSKEERYWREGEVKWRELSEGGVKVVGKHEIYLHQKEAKWLTLSADK